MDPVTLARIQFALTIGFHFIFPPISIGLAWMLVVLEWMAWKNNDEQARRATKLFSKLLAINFAIGVATGIVMEFQFGTNWRRYSEFVGDIFGAPLAAEGVFAFFMESTFLGVYLFGGKRISPKVRWISILMVAIGSALSAFWIIVANSWQQTPAGYVIRNGRAELTSFYDAVFNPSTLVRYFHTVDAALITGAFFVAGVSAYHLLKDPTRKFAQKSMKAAVIFGLIVSVAELFPFGHFHAEQVAQTQPEKFATMEGLTKTQKGAPLLAFGIPSDGPDGPKVSARIEIPKGASLLGFGDANAEVKGLEEWKPKDRPPFLATFTSFHMMVALGSWFILLAGLGVLQLKRGKLYEDRRLLKLFLFTLPLPVLGCEVGWITAEVGRQPWIVWHLMRTSDAHSVSVTSGEILSSIIMFGLVYLVLGALWGYLLFTKGRIPPDGATDKPAETHDDDDSSDGAGADPEPEAA